MTTALVLTNTSEKLSFTQFMQQVTCIDLTSRDNIKEKVPFPEMTYIPLVAGNFENTTVYTEPTRTVQKTLQSRVFPEELEVSQLVKKKDRLSRNPEGNSRFHDPATEIYHEPKK